MTIDDIAQRLSKVKRTAHGRISALCPGHDDRNPSLSVAEGTNGRLLLHCHAGCSVESVVAAIGLDMKDLYSECDQRSMESSVGLPSVRFNGSGGVAKLATSEAKCPPRMVSAKYQYTDECGELLYENVRYEPKEFRQRRPDGNGGYIYNLNGVRRVPYRLPDLIEAVAKGETEVWFAEGEKDADNLRSLGFIATSFKNWKPDFNEHIKGIDAIIVIDHDRSSVNQANDAAGLIAKTARSVKIIDNFEDEPLAEKNGKDVSDWIDARRCEGDDDKTIAERLSIIADGAKVWRPAESDATKRGTDRFQFSFTTLDELYKEPDEETEYVWDRTLPAGGFSIVSAKPKVGKSTFLRNLAVAISRGEPILGRDTSVGRVLYLCLEEKRHEVRKHFVMMGAVGDTILVHSGSRPQTTEEAVAALRSSIEEFHPVIVFIDPLSRVIRSADFNDYRITYALEHFIDLARDTGVHISALHHEGKGDRSGGDAILGSTALFGAVDCHLSMKKRQNGRTISSTQRYGDDLPETVVELNKETGLIIDKGDLETAIMAEVKQEILSVIGSECIEGKDIREALSHRKGGLVSKALSSLVEEGTIQRSGGGKRGDPYRYFMENGNLQQVEKD